MISVSYTHLDVYKRQVMDKDSRITLDVYIDVMEDIFKCMHASDQTLHFKTLEFQETHLRYISQKLG